MHSEIKNVVIMDLLNELKEYIINIVKFVEIIESEIKNSKEMDEKCVINQNPQQTE